MFENCYSLAELKKAKNIEISKINKAYADRKEELDKPTFNSGTAKSKLDIIFESSLNIEAPQFINAFNLEIGKAAPNQIIINQSGSVSI